MSELRRDPRIKLGDLLKIRPSDIIVEKGFNVRMPGAALEGHINGIKTSIMIGDIPPPLIVKLSGPQVILRDGHCRLEAYRRAIQEGTPIEYIDAVEWRGSDIDAVVYMVKSASGKPLDPLEVSCAYKRLRAFNWTEEMIGRRFGKTEAHVRQLLLLADADHTIQELVRNNRIAASTAVKMIQAHGPQATDVIAAAAAEAAAAGKAKITPRYIKRVRGGAGTVSIPANRQDMVAQALSELAACLRQPAAMTEKYGATVIVPARLIETILSCVNLEAAVASAEGKVTHLPTRPSGAARFVA
jgi:ParB family chromosome partitioning protein